MRYGLNRHRRRHLMITTVCSGADGLHMWAEQWKIKGAGLKPSDVTALKRCTKLDFGDDAVITSITPVV